jgi:CRISPR-associated protein Csm4
MTTWRLRLRPRAPWATPIRADSLFGAICWRWLELFPERFDSMLEEFHHGGTPPFVLSDALPGDLMPVPMYAKLPPLDKKSKPPFYFPQASFQSLIYGETETASDVPEKNAISASSRVQTAIDRDLGFAADGQLFETDTQHLDRSCNFLSVYIRSVHYVDQVVACFKVLALTGFGKKSSTGLGSFELAGLLERCEWLEAVPGANAYMALSHFVPAPGDPADGRWRTHVTFPKFHGNAVSNVFKGSILMLAPGSVFRTGGESPRPWYGSMSPVPRLEMPKAVHYGLCFSVPLVWHQDTI